MAVFTSVSDTDARNLLTHFTLGEFVSLRGITAGIENTNYFLTTTQDEYVLTLFEVLTQEQLPFYIELMHHLAQGGIPVPKPQTLRDCSRLTRLHGKPCAIVSRLPGGYETAPGPAILRGAALRFWLSRLYDFFLPRPAQTLKPHDPRHFENVLNARTVSTLSTLP